MGLARAAELARQRGVDVDWVQADLLRYEPAPAEYDLVLIAYIQLPADDLAHLVRTAATAVAPGGTLLAVGHDRDNLGPGSRRPAVSPRPLDTRIRRRRAGRAHRRAGGAGAAARADR